MPRLLSYALVARLLAAVLLLAAGLKIIGLRSEPVAAAGIFSTPEFQVALVEIEIVLAIWLWSGVRPVLSWLVALVTFTGFAAASFYLAWIGQSSCGCFGSLHVNPWFTLTLDSAILIGLALGRPDLAPLWANPRRELVEGCRPALVAAAGMAAMFAILWSVALYGFGSAPEALAYLRGERVSVQPRLVNMGEGQPGELRQVAVEVANWTDKPIRVIGASRDCSCSVDGLPVSIPPKQKRPISLKLRLSGQPGIFTRSATLLLDDDGFQHIAFRLTGRILPKDETPVADGG